MSSHARVPVRNVRMHRPARPFQMTIVSSRTTRFVRGHSQAMRTHSVMECPATCSRARGGENWSHLAT
jgi:hypothetical protein